MSLGRTGAPGCRLAGAGSREQATDGAWVPVEGGLPGGRGGATGDSCCWLLISRLIPLPWRYNDLVLQRKVVGIGDERGLSAVKHQDFFKAAARKICVPTPCSSSRGTKSPVRPEGSAFVVGVHAWVGGSAADVMASDLSTGSAASATLH